MVNIDELKQKELESLQDNNKELIDLEDLLLAGSKAVRTIIIDYPTENGMQELGAKIRPLTSVEWNNAMQTGMKRKDSNPAVEIVKKGLLTKNEEPFPNKLVENMVSGAIDEIFKAIAEISGVKLDPEEQKQMAKELMGF